MKHAAPVRKELGVRTLFNILGPLTNPAGARRQLMGVFHPDLVGIQVRVLQRLGSERVLVVYGRPQESSPGLDELSLSGETLVGELVDGQVREYAVHPSDFGLPVYPLSAFKASSTSESKAVLLSVLANQAGPARDIVILNAGAALYAAGVAADIKEGVARAREAIESGAARAKLDQFIEFTQRVSA
jgi:anthranilate phosphoribosyltransferase